MPGTRWRELLCVDNPDEVIEVSRDDPYLQAFRLAALNRQSRLSKIEDLAAQWPELGLLLFELYAAGGSCGGAAVAAMTGAGIPLAVALLLGCGGSVAGFLYTGNEIARDAGDLANAMIAWWQHDSDARYNFCRMEGGSDADCRDREG